MEYRFPGLRGPCRLPLLGILSVGFLLCYLVVLGPHLGHHIVDGNSGQPACPHLVQSQQAPAVQVDPPTLAPPEPAEPLKAALAGTVVLLSADTPYPPRAPPRPPEAAWS